MIGITCLLQFASLPMAARLARPRFLGFLDRLVGRASFRRQLLPNSSFQFSLCTRSRTAPSGIRTTCFRVQEARRRGSARPYGRRRRSRAAAGQLYDVRICRSRRSIHSAQLLQRPQHLLAVLRAQRDRHKMERGEESRAERRDDEGRPPPCLAWLASDCIRTTADTTPALSVGVSAPPSSASPSRSISS